MFSLLRSPHALLRASAPSRPFLTVVDQATVAYRQLLGMNRVRLDPGLRLALPIVHDIRKVDTREGRIDMDSMTAVTKDNIMVNASGTLFFRVIDAEKACFSVQDYKNSVDRVGHSTIRSVIGSQDYDAINSGRNAINAMLVDTIGTTIDQWGVLCTRFEIQSIVPTSREVIKQLELQMEAERLKRKNVLDTDAAIKTAEGAKTTAILVSEGKLQAEKNRAESEFILAQRKAESVAYAIQTETIAMKTQVIEITAAMGGDSKAAAAFLVEQQKLKHMATLASSAKNTSTYFLGDANNLVPSAKVFGDLQKSD